MSLDAQNSQLNTEAVTKSIFRHSHYLYGEIIMRLDKFLKVSRLIKRRTVANDACDGEKVMVNGRVVKASYAVKVGDVIELTMGQRTLKVEVLNISEHANKADAAGLYKEIV